MNEERDSLWTAMVETEAYEAICASSIHQEMIGLAAAALSGASRVLDAGCGYGSLAERAAHTATEVVALDFNEAMLRRAETRLQKSLTPAQRERVSFRRGDAANLEASDGQFDGVASLNVLLNLADPERAMREAFRVLTPRGRYVVSGPIGDADPADLARAFATGTEDARRAGHSEQALQAIAAINQQQYAAGHIAYRPKASELFAGLERAGFRPLEFRRIYGGGAYFVVSLRP